MTIKLKLYRFDELLPKAQDAAVAALTNQLTCVSTMSSTDRRTFTRGILMTLFMVDGTPIEVNQAMRQSPNCELAEELGPVKKLDG